MRVNGNCNVFESREGEKEVEEEEEGEEGKDSFFFFTGDGLGKILILLFSSIIVEPPLVFCDNTFDLDLEDDVDPFFGGTTASCILSSSTSKVGPDDPDTSIPQSRYPLPMILWFSF